MTLPLTDGMPYGPSFGSTMKSPHAFPEVTEAFADEPVRRLQAESHPARRVLFHADLSRMYAGGASVAWVGFWRTIARPLS